VKTVATCALVVVCVAGSAQLASCATEPRPAPDVPASTAAAHGGVERTDCLRALKIRSSRAPGCARSGAAAGTASFEGRRIPALVRRAARRYGTVGNVECTRARSATDRPIRRRALCVAWIRSWPRCGVMYEVRQTGSDLAVLATYVPWCASELRRA
jgi:hypothetical protein